MAVIEHTENPKYKTALDGYIYVFIYLWHTVIEPLRHMRMCVCVCVKGKKERERGKI